MTNLTEHADAGHLVILNSTGEQFVCAHSTDGEALTGVRANAHVPAVPPSLRTHEHHGDAVGPDVQYHALFPAPGRYKVWAEFAPGADRVTADFVVDVAAAKGAF